MLAIRVDHGCTAVEHQSRQLPCILTIRNPAKGTHEIAPIWSERATPSCRVENVTVAAAETKDVAGEVIFESLLLKRVIGSIASGHENEDFCEFTELLVIHRQKTMEMKAVKMLAWIGNLASRIVN